MLRHQLPSQAALTSPTGLSQNPDGRHLFLSGRFNNPKSKAYMKLVKEELDAKGVNTFMVHGAPGERYGPKTHYGMVKAKAMAAFCSGEYGAWTGVGYETYWEVKYAHEQHIPIIPIRLCETFPPQPSDEEGRIQNGAVFSNLDLHTTRSDCFGFLKGPLHLSRYGNFLQSLHRNKPFGDTKMDSKDKSHSLRPFDFGK